MAMRYSGHAGGGLSLEAGFEILATFLCFMLVVEDVNSLLLLLPPVQMILSLQGLCSAVCLLHYHHTAASDSAGLSLLLQEPAPDHFI